MRLLYAAICMFSMPALGWTLVSGGIQGWSAEELSINVNYANCPVPDSVLDDALDAAIEAWNGVPTARLKLKRGTSATDVATFTGGTATDVPVLLCDPNLGTTLGTDVDNIPGVAVQIQGNPNIFYGGILLNAQAGAGAEISNLSDLELQITLAHELGHILGLGHSSTSSALMYFNVSTKTELLVMDDDKDGLSYLYPSNFGCVAVHRAGGKPVRFFVVLFTVVFATVLLGRIVFRARQA